MSAAIGECYWQSFEIGVPVQTAQLYTAVQQNAVGWKTADPYTTLAAPNQYKMHIKLMEMERWITFVNQTTAKIHVEFYELSPRRDLYSNSEIGSYNPEQLITYRRDSDLQATGTTQIGAHDPRMNPFECPWLVQSWIISKVRKIKVGPGGVFKANISCNNRMFVPGCDDPYVLANLEYKKNKSKVLLVKIFGEVCVAQVGEPAVGYVRNGLAEAVWKLEDKWKAHLSYETRKIFNDNNVAKNTNVAGAATTVSEIRGVIFTEETNVNPGTS